MAQGIPGIDICGKTGTAQNPHGKDHSLFISFAPRYNPKIAVAVIVENAGFGSTYAAPISNLVIEKYLLPRYNHTSTLPLLERIKNSVSGTTMRYQSQQNREGTIGLDSRSALWITAVDRMVEYLFRNY